MKDKYVAVSYCDDGSCDFIGQVKTIGQQEYNKLKNEFEKNKAQKEKKLNQHLVSHELIEQHIYKNNFMLAKAIYDKFVDRGLIEDDLDFQKAFYDYIFNGVEIENIIKDAPKDFVKILEKVGA